jgi:hypothetical protein
VSARNVHPTLSITDWRLALAYDSPSRLALADPGIDDSVDDTGGDPKRSDLQHSDEFACLMKVICEERGEFS